MIEIQSIRKSFGSRVAVDALSLQVEPGEIYGFLGANGAGKTTTIRMLLGVLAPDAGVLKVCGRPVQRGDRSGRMLVGAVGESQHFHDDMTCRDYLKYFGDLFGLENADDTVSELLEEVGLDDRGDDLAVALSKGLQQKLGLARALLHDPPVLVLDEPISGLDPNSVREFREIVSRERDKGRLVFFSSHILSEVSLLADRVGIMNEGRLVCEASVESVLAKFGSLENAFVSATGLSAVERALAS